MCGIAGIVGGRPDPGAIARMVEAMRHRGPDDNGVWRGERLALGATRLAIQDLGPGGHQPMASPGGDVRIVYNGEMYNAPEERGRLEGLGHRFASTSDTEVVLALYLRHGADFLARIRGIFALAIVDCREDPSDPVVLLARDPLGVKPLLLARGAGGALVFASEMKALLASGLVRPAVAPRALRSLLETGAVHQPETMLRDAAMIEPAHRATIRGGRARSERYWRLSDRRDGGLAAAGYAEQAAAVGAKLRDTVRAQSIGDAPIGAFLSGGVDSATVAALMAADAGASVKTFSVGFGPELRAIDETGAAARFAAHLGADHARLEVGPETVRANIEAIVDGIDQPSIDGLNTWLVSRAAGAEVKVAMSGTGGDDLFMGYPWHADMLRSEETGDRFLARYAESAGGFHRTFGRSEADGVIAPALAAESARDTVADYRAMDELAGAGPVQRIAALTLRGYTRNQLLRDIDAMSMAHSLEVRVPYLDTEFIDLAIALPAEAKLARGAPDAPMRNSYRASGIKRVLIDVARPLLPAGFDDAPKRGFGIPFTPWLNGPLRGLVADVLRPERVARTGLLNPVVMGRVRAALAEGRRLTGWRLWLMLVVQLWAERMGVEPGR